MLTGKKPNIGVWGVGSIESRHARLLGKRSDVGLYLCDANPSHLDAAKEWVNLRGATDSFEEMMIGSGVSYGGTDGKRASKQAKQTSTSVGQV